MTVLPQFSGPAMTPLAMGQALTQRDVGFGQFLGASIGQGFEDSLLGIAIADIPPLLTDTNTFVEESVEDWRAMHPPGTPLSPDDEAEMRDYFRRQAEERRNDFTPMSAEQWRASPSFREDIPYEDGMTAERAAALAERYDETRFRQWLVDNHEGVGWGISTVAGFAATVLGGAASPEAFIPFAGPAMRAAAVARLGSIGGRAAVGAFEGALGTAAVLPLIAMSRAQIGDEMAWSDAALEIAIGALAGGAFGGTAGVFSRGADARAARQRVLLTDLRVANEALTKVEIARQQIAEGVPVDVPTVSARSAEAIALGERIQAATNEALRSGPVAITPSGQSVPVRFAVVDVADLVTSHADDLAVNPAYPADLQPRDRSRAASEMQIQGMANDIRPALLIEGASASDGAPIVGGDMVVESGNGRVIALRRAYGRGALEGYRSAIEAAGYSTEGVRNPVLVRIREGEMTAAERAAFARDANARTTAAMSVTERAMADARAIPDSALDLYRGGDITLAGNRQFVRELIDAVVPESERGAMYDRDGVLSQEGRRRLEAALLGKAYDDASLVGTLLEDSDTNIKAIGGALLDVAPMWAKMRGEVATGAIAEGMDVTPQLLDAVRLVRRARNEGRSVAEFVGQGDLLTGSGPHPSTVLWLGSFFRDRKYSSPRGRERIAADLQEYVNEAGKTHAGADMFGFVSSADETLRGVRERADAREGQLQAGLFGRVAEGDGGGDGGGREALPGRGVADRARPSVARGPEQPVPVEQQLAKLPESPDPEAEAPELLQFAELERAGTLTETERNAMAAAVEAEQKAAHAAEAYASATACVLRG